MSAYLSLYLGPRRFSEVHLHGLGAAIGFAVNLALHVVQKSGAALSLAATTSTVDLVDDFQPLTEVSAQD